MSPRNDAALVCAFALTSLLWPATAGAQHDPSTPRCEIPAAHRPTEEECAKYPTFESSIMDEVLPNNTLHLVLRGRTELHFSDEGPSLTLGPGALFGVAPGRTQSLRISLGADVQFGRWIPSEEHTASIDPRLRVSVSNAAYAPTLIPLDLFLSAVAPVGTNGSFSIGGELGLGVRPFNAIVVELSYQAVGEYEPPDTRMSTVLSHQVALSAGADFFGLFGVTRKAKSAQTLADLRCTILQAARAMYERKRASLGPATPRPPYCAAVDEYLHARDARPRCSDGDDRPECEPLAGLWSAMGQQASDLTSQSGALWRCARKATAIQRGCHACTRGKTLATWLLYSVDPYQVATALGCTGALREEADAASMAIQCESRATAVANEAADELCPAMSPAR